MTVENKFTNAGTYLRVDQCTKHVNNRTQYKSYSTSQVYSRSKEDEMNLDEMFLYYHVVNTECANMVVGFNATTMLYYHAS